jgi:2-polyprenyl-3-methyl-5-hydroxy-6-metoxy-1,4-benzoquinol methylase
LRDSLERQVSIQNETADRSSFNFETELTNVDSGMPSAHASATATLPYTGERLVPGKTAEPLFREHEARYRFAGNFVRGKTVLDIACGTGIGTHYLLGAGAERCFGLDIDHDAIEYARAAYQSCSFSCCDARDISFPDCSIDVVVSFETIEHLMDPLKFLGECKRVLRPGGILICSTPNRTMYSWAGKNPYHFREFSITEFADLLETMFTEVRLFEQSKKVWLLYAGQALLSGFLDKLQLKQAVKKILRWEPRPPILHTEFGVKPSAVDDEIRPYRPVPLMRPMFVISVARRSF